MPHSLQGVVCRSVAVWRWVGSVASLPSLCPSAWDTGMEVPEVESLPGSRNMNAAGPKASCGLYHLIYCLYDLGERVRYIQPLIHLLFLKKAFFWL